MDTIVSNVQQIAKQADEAGRKKLIDTLNQLVWSIEGPQDLMQRLLYLHVYISVVRAAIDMKLFNIISESSGPLHAKNVAIRAGSAPELTARILRYLSSVGALKETAADTYVANDTTKTLAEPGWQSAVIHNFDLAWPVFFNFAAFLKEDGYKDIVSASHCPFTKGFKAAEGETLFDVLPRDPFLFGHFQKYMTVQRLGMPTWLDSYPYQETLKDLKPDQPFFVDVGGGMGHQAVALRKLLPPDFQHRIIVQDQKPVLTMAMKEPGVEHMEYDFWTPQTVKGARIYYMRNVIHDWPDAQATKILANQKSAMGPEAVLLIDDMVMPSTGAHWQATQLDILMMNCLASCERSEPQHTKVIEDAGLRISKITKYTTSLSDSIIECVLA